MSMGGIASMLGRSGMITGQNIGAPVANFGNQLGGILTGLPGVVKDSMQRSEAERLIKEYEGDAGKLEQQARVYGAQGNDQLSRLFANAAAQTRERTAATTTKEQQIQMQQLMAEASEAMTSGDARALANVAKKMATIDPKAGLKLSQEAQDMAEGAQTRQRGGNVQSALGAVRAAAAQGVPLTQLAGLQKYITDNDGTQEQIQEAYDSGLSKKKEIDGGVTSSRSGGQYKDPDGNIWEVDLQRTSKGTKKQYIPISPNAPETPTGRLTPIGGQFGETSVEALEREVGTAANKTTEQEFSKSRVAAVESLPELQRTKGRISRSLELIEGIQTGGFTNAVKRRAQEIFGVQPADDAEFAFLAGQQVLDGLSNFTGAISEGERKYLEGLYQDLSRSGFANKAILTRLLSEYESRIQDAMLKAESSDFDDYMKKLASRDDKGEVIEASFSDYKRKSQGSN